jgi:DNA mismatch repair ATPase MutS
MSGFPLVHLDRHLKTLVQLERRFVAMCEEFPLHSNTNSKEFERRITRIITPGTLIDESFLNPLDNNYLLAISPSSLSSAPAQTIGLAWIDVSTGEFFSKLGLLECLRDELARIAPREVVLDLHLKDTPNHPIFSVLANIDCPKSYTSPPALQTNTNPPFQHDPALPSLAMDRHHRQHGLTEVSSPESAQQQTVQFLNFGPSEDLNSLPTEESFAIALLTKFLKENLMEHMPLLERPIREGSQELMQIDSHTIQDLEIRESIYEGGTKGCLLSVVKRTTTNGGARLLARWLCEPPQLSSIQRH